MVITRYLYKPTASEGNTRFNDNRRLHIFIADLATKQVRQLTDGIYSEHSIDWSPVSDEIAFVSNREPDQDFVFNNDLFAAKVSDGSIRRITATENAEFARAGRRTERRLPTRPPDAASPTSKRRWRTRMCGR